MSSLSLSSEKLKKNYTSSFKLITRVKPNKDSLNYNLEVTNEGMEYLNQLNSNLIGIISIIGPEKSEKSFLSNLILGDKAAFDSSEHTTDIYMWGQPIAQGENTDLLVLDTEGLYRPINSNTNFDKQIFILSCLTSSVMIYNTNDTIQDCILKFTSLAKESLSCIKKIEGKDLTSTDLPLVYFILHNNNIDSNTANQQFRNLVKDNPIFSIFFQNYKICVLKKAGDIKKDIKRKSDLTKKLEDIGSLSDQDYKQKAKLIKDQIMNDLEPKKINNCNIDGKCLFGLLQVFVESLNKKENIILYNQFNDVLASCLKSEVDLINYSFKSKNIQTKIENTLEETYLDIIKTTFSQSFKEQCDLFISKPIAKISPSINVYENIKLIFETCLNVLYENIQANIDKKKQIINDTAKLEFDSKIKNFNIQQSLWNFNNFILEKILSPLYEKNELKLQNNDNILKLLKDKICGTLEIFAPKIQNIVDKLIAENKTLRNEFEQFKKNYKNEIKEKDEEVLSRKLILDKREEEMKERELTVGETLKHEQLKFDKLKEKYNKEINEKNAKIEELMKVSKTLSKTNDTSGTNVNNINNIQIQELQKDYNDITNIFVNYKLLVNKLITDEDFFFENILIDKSIGNIKKKYPEIFDLLSLKKSLEEITNGFESEKEGLNNEKKTLLIQIEEKKKEIEEFQKKLNTANQNAEENKSLYKGALTNYEYEKRINDSLKREYKEQEIKYKKNIENKEKEYSKEKDSFQEEKKNLVCILYSILTKNKNLYDNTIDKLSIEVKNNIISYINLWGPKW